MRIRTIFLVATGAAAAALVAASVDSGIVSDASVIAAAFLAVVTVGLIGAAVFERWFYPAVSNPHLAPMRSASRAQRKAKCSQCRGPLTPAGSLLICETCDGRPSEA